MFRPVRTQTEATDSEWLITDEVIRLRTWATDDVYPLPEPPATDCTIGAAATCGIQLADPEQLVSRLHGRLVRESGRWILRDHGSKNGIRLDHSKRAEIYLVPGLEIGIGSLTLVPESPRSIRLRDFIGRLIGWNQEQAARVEHIMHAIRMSASSRMPLLICGDTDVVPLARALHARVRGAERPFVVFDRRRLPGMNGMDAFAAAQSGTLCVRSRRLPVDFPMIADALREPDARVQLIICAERGESWDRYGLMPMLVPPLTQRTPELDRIIAAYAADAADKLMTPRTAFTAEDHAWVRDYASRTLPEIEKATARRLAVRISHNLPSAASRLNMGPVSLSRWLERREAREAAVEQDEDFDE